MAGDGGTRLTHLAGVYSERNYPLYDELALSLGPAGPRSLHELAGQFLTPESRVLDAGCRDAQHLLLLARLHGCSGVGIDPLRSHVEAGVRNVAAAGLGARVSVVRGVVERLPHCDASFDLVWCRDVLSVLEDVGAAMAEFARVLTPRGHGVIYTNFATELIEAGEATRINLALGNVSASMDQANVEAAIARAGLAIQERREVGTEWREFEEESTRPVSDDLLKLARLRRRREDFVAKFGPEAVDVAEASLHWLAYQLLGKLKPVIYVLRRA